MPMSSDLRNAFNAVAEGKATASKAYHRYEHEHDAEFEVVSFAGSLADGSPFEIESTKLRGGSDLIAAAGDAARALLAKQEKAPTP